MLKIFNSLTNKKEEIKPIEEGLIKMYTCGPTVYYYQHIGNMRAYIFMDSLRRVIKYNGYKIKGVMNVTDVGHLTSDEDSGEDKMELASKRENKTPQEIANFYAGIFFSDLKKLNIDIPENITYATHFIPQMIEFVKGLEEKGYTYKIDDGIYFDVQKFPEYGQLSNKDLSKTGNARIEENKNKHHPFDFALWKFVEPNHIMKWDSPWGVGCPGWHIECSAMGRTLLGDRFDIHTGGIDHKTIHHEDEIAQNDALAGHRVVNTWVHNEFLLVDGGKMSKSLGNIYTLEDLEKRGYSAMDFKYFCLNTHYGKKLNFTFDGLTASKNGYKNLKTLINEHKFGTAKIDKDTISLYKKKFLDAINDDLNIPLAIGQIFTILKTSEKSKDIYDLVLDFDRALGLELDACENHTSLEIPAEISTLAQQRWEAKKNKDYQKSDELRAVILQKGYVVKDNKDGYTIEKLEQ